MKKRFTEEQIAFALRQAEGGTPVTEVCRKRTWNELRMRLRDLAAVRIRYGYRRLHVLPRREGWKVNHKLVWRLYREEGLFMRIKGRKKKTSRLGIILPEAKAPNERWSDLLLLMGTGGRGNPPFSFVG
jgi:hypothetical protein